MEATIETGDLALGAEANLTVVNPSPGGGASNVLIFSIDNLGPTLTVMTPLSVPARGTGFNLTVNGSNFSPAAYVQWNDALRPTTFVSSAELRTVITAADISQPGPASITVFNPPPGGGTSNVLTFTVNPPNRAPTANAGPTISVDELSSVTFTGATASDPDPGDLLAISWTISGGSANGTLAGANTLTPTYTAPDLTSEAVRTVTTVLTVTDGSGATATSNKTITVNRTLSVTGVTFKRGTLSIAGTGFAAGAIVKVDGVVVSASVNVAGTTSITVAGSRKQLGIKPKRSSHTFQVVQGSNNSNVFPASP